MNHCITCGHRINAGRTAHASNNTQCLICIERNTLRNWRYVSPAMKRWRKKTDHERETDQSLDQSQSRQLS
jgi:hypothetical protein